MSSPWRRRHLALMKSLRKLVDVVDVWNTPAKDPNNKGELPKRTEEKKKFLKNLALAVVPLKLAVVPLSTFLLEFCAILGSKTSSNPWGNGKIKAKERKQRWRGS